jgi:heat shock protein HspQ
MKTKFQIGDLVEFSFTHSIGIVMDIKKEPTFQDYDDIYDVLVYWSDGELFWCMDFTLRHVLTYGN